MKTILLAVLALLGASLLAGCTYQPEARIVDFSSVDESQPGARFELRVKVVGLDNGSTPISGAFVGAAEGVQAIAKGTTDGNGIAVLRVQTGQTIRVVASAQGWTTEDSGRIGIGRAASSGDSSGSSVGCAGGVTQDESGQAAGGWCMVTAGENDDRDSTRLTGDRGNVSVVLFRKEVRQAFAPDLGPNANLRVTTLPDGREWIPFHEALQDDPGFHELQMLRFASATTMMEWENNLLAQADFELGVGCVKDAPEVRTSELLPKLPRQQVNRLTLEFGAKDEGRWSGCGDYYVGPIVETANSPIDVRLESVLTFRGRSAIIPIGD